jgi:hypothetical protein
MGMTTIIIAVSESFINSGFGAALIRKQNSTDVDRFLDSRTRSAGRQ